ncbi:unnamed protein product [Caenorhabditis sp. 36 PRJEB53466]|nr:unnamed protein product [Caenorhabditis sp. 36 PRJEB53466]
MISVGIRLSDEVFPPPEEPIAERKGATENPKMHLNGIDEISKTARINRIVLTRSANVELLRADSPSSIWVRLQNHITDKTLTFREPLPLESITEMKVGDYVLAPNEERSFRRCRITEVCQNGKVARVFFIDDASLALVNRECLCKLDEHWMFYPWQAIQISMCGIYPALSNTSETAAVWSPEACDELRKILREFRLLKVDVILSSVVFNDYARPNVVHLQGIVDPDDTLHQSEIIMYKEPKWMSISSILLENAPTTVISMPIFDSAVHEFFGTDDEDVLAQMDYHKIFPEDWKHKDVLETDQEKELFSKDSMSPNMEHSDWDPRQNQVRMRTLAELKTDFRFPEKVGERNRKPRIMLAVEGRCTKNPYEWYARPIHKTGKGDVDDIVEWDQNKDLREVNKVDWMMHGNSKLLAFAEILDTFYSKPKNRKPLRSEEIKRMREEGVEVFAVCAVNEEKAMYTGEWQRVLILNCADFADVRFLDSGGRDMVLTSSLYRIHRQHCETPAMCLQLSMHGISTQLNNNRADKKWHVKETTNFKLCLREDVPIFIDCDDLRLLIPPSQNDPRPHMTKHVFLARDVSYLDESNSVLDRFIGLLEGYAQRSVADPVLWP